MFDIVQSMLRISYYYSRFLGVLNFEIDSKTGYARITTQSTIYAAVVNVVLVCLIPSLTQSELLHILWKNAGQLHEYLILVVMGMRVGCIIATLFSRWLQRHRLIYLVNAVRQLTIQKPQVIRMWRGGVIKKFTSILVSEVVQMMSSILALRAVLTFNLIVTIISLYVVTALVNVIISHYYFIMLNIHNHYILLKQELRSVLSQTRDLEEEQRKATFMIKCCTLADQLEVIARRQSELQKLVDLMTIIFGIQGICIASSSYISCIGSIYFTFSAIKRSAGMTCGLNVYMLSGIVIGVYLLDLGITIDNTFTVLDDHDELEQLLEEYSSFGIGLDKRLETVFESFQLQLARHRLEIPILGLYNMDKTMGISMTNSIILNSIVLIQYELKYS
ncbi:hypothetical protein KR215_010195 [Drosophila sulfurigaster]|nr:hypothetical protein KR215_010195 [Drosophila sulfurigaster]